MNDEIPQELTVISEANRKLAQAQSVEEVKNLSLLAERARELARGAKLGLEKQKQFAEYKLRCDRKAGMLLKELGLAPGRPRKEKRSHGATILADLGIDKSESSRLQQEARVPEELFELYVAKAHEKNEEITTKGFLRFARQQGQVAPSCGTDAGKTPRQGKPAQSMVLDSIAVAPAEELAKLDTVREFFGDLRDHHRQLVKQLEEYCGERRLKGPELAKRQYVGQLLREMGEMFAAAAAVLGME